jgi:hypothetical protein
LTNRFFLSIYIAFLFTGCASTQSKFEMNEAIQIAGELVSPNNEQFFMFHIPDNSPINETSIILSKHLVEAAKSKANLAIIGPDFDLNFEVLKKSLASHHANTLKGANVIYLGYVKQFKELDQLSEQVGVTFISAKYP